MLKAKIISYNERLAGSCQPFENRVWTMSCNLN